ncbi:NAD(P)H-dependent 6'-deoxychalcone synthase [Spatholobus suberectus]|nr:NAD(P)H-dependent 6'-deoxychalcone synthase [Spatholobus suberectus]
MSATNLPKVVLQQPTSKSNPISMPVIGLGTAAEHNDTSTLPGPLCVVTGGDFLQRHSSFYPPLILPYFFTCANIISDGDAF